MSFLAHLDELRRRLLLAAAGILVGLVACYAVSDRVLALLIAPVQDGMGTLTVIRPAEAFMNRLKAAAVGGLFLSLPWIFWQAWAFVAPGLYRRERRWVVPFIASGTVLFLAGAGFCYVVAMPAAVTFLASQGEGYTSNVTLDYAFSFSTKLLLGLGVVFEMPLAMFVLARTGLVTPRLLFRRLDVAVFGCFLAAAIVTPTPDIMTMSIFALPMVGLYLLGAGVAWLAAPRDRRRRGGDDSGATP